MALAALVATSLASVRQTPASFTERDALRKAAECIKYQPDVPQGLANALRTHPEMRGRTMKLASSISVTVTRSGCGAQEHVYGATFPADTTKIGLVGALNDDQTQQIDVIAAEMDSVPGTYRFLIAQSDPMPRNST